MTPDEIKNFIEASFPNIVSEPRHNPYGWAFYLKEVRKHPTSSRIARATQREGSPTEFKLAVSSLKQGQNIVIYDPSEQQVQEKVEHEIMLLENQQ
jgi:hypothetical protein